MRGWETDGVDVAKGLMAGLSQAPVGVAQWRGPNHIFELASPLYLRIVGRANVLGERLRDVLPEPRYAETLAKLCDRVYETGETFTASEYPLELDGDGVRVTGFFSLTLSALRDAQHAVSGLIAVATDVTGQVLARRRAEALAQRLAESETLLRLTQEVSPIGFVHYRAIRGADRRIVDFELLYQNKAASLVNGFPEGLNATGLTMSSMFPDVRGTELWASHCAVVESGVPSQEETRYQLGGRDNWYRVARSRPAPDHLAITFDDVTEAKRAADQQREEAAINTILLRVSRSISGLDLEAIVQGVTDEATTICRADFGAFFYNRLDARGESYMLYTLSGVPRSAFEKFPMPRNTAVFGPTFSGERIVRSDDITQESSYGHSEPYRGMPPGHLPVRSYLAVPVVSRSGEVLGGLFFGHARPGVFTERDEQTVAAIAQQAAVAMDNARLFEIAQRERALAEEVGRTKDEFLATISHELRTPLQSILGWTHMLRTGALPEDTQKRALEAVERNARAQAAIVEDVLDVSRIIAGKLRIEVTPVQLSEVVKAALDTVRPAADARNIRLQAVIDPEAGTVMGDPNRLQQVVWNLLSNAVKFSARGGRVYVHLRRDHSSVEIVIADTGQGIPSDFLPHVFERFRQIDATSTRTSGGLGLGLSIVKHLVELHGGTIVAESEGLEKGATFTVRVPIAPLSSTVVDPTPPLFLQPDTSLQCPYVLEGLKVLVVDDEEDARELLRTVLEHCKAHVLLASNSRDALHLLRTQRPDLLVSDIGMPHEDGYTLIEKVRALPLEAGGRTPAVALTAYARSEDRTKALARGFNHHVPKPVNPNELLVVIASLIDRLLK